MRRLLRTIGAGVLVACGLASATARGQIMAPPTGPAPAARAPVPVPGGDLYAANLGISYRVEPYGGGIGARLTRPPAPGTAAAQIQLEPGDFITHLDGRALYGPNDLLNHAGRTTVQFVNIRTGQPQVGVVWIAGGAPNPNPYPNPYPNPGPFPPAPAPPPTYTLGVNVVTVALPAGPVYGAYVAPRAPAYALQITGLTPGMPAQRAGLEVGDIIVSINGRPTANVGDLRAALAASNGQASLAVRDVRTGQQTFVPVWLGYAMPPGAPAAAPAPAVAPNVPMAPASPGPFAPGGGRPS
jgi:membrane-associated protease RseP (regulator of RpoE activity)